MAVLSTLQIIPTEVDTATMYMQQSGGTSHPVTNGASSITGHNLDDTPAISIDDLAHGFHFAPTTLASTSSNSLIDNHMDHQYGVAPADGNTVWYCSSCGDGPIGSWNNVCTSCGHAYCAACTVEKTA